MSFFKRLQEYENKNVVLTSLIIGLILGYTTGTLNSRTEARVIEPIETSERTPSVVELETTVKELERRIADVEAIQQPQGLPRPDYDSGWNLYTPGMTRTFEHNLSSKYLLVYLVGRQFGHTIIRWYVEGSYYLDPTGHGWYIGAQWTIEDENSIEVQRLIDDGLYHEIRVLIWKIPTTN